MRKSREIANYKMQLGGTRSLDRGRQPEVYPLLGPGRCQLALPGQCQAGNVAYEITNIRDRDCLNTIFRMKKITCSVS
jgi:hypothetical protein